ncbi:Uncharacterised protein [Streptococcus pneumoniae]|nr:Uncharacterised protein [Streptococcus pneumoniae]
MIANNVLEVEVYYSSFNLLYKDIFRSNILLGLSFFAILVQ